MRAVLHLVREAAASARSQPAASVLTVVMIAGICVAALLTTGRTVAAEGAVLAELDSVGTRSVIVRADRDAGVTAEILDQLAVVDAVEQATGFGPITDARNARIPGAPPVPVRHVYGDLASASRLSAEIDNGSSAGSGLVMAAASEMGADQLGLIDGVGGVTTSDGVGLTVNRALDVPEHLRFPNRWSSSHRQSRTTRWPCSSCWRTSRITWPR